MLYDFFGFERRRLWTFSIVMFTVYRLAAYGSYSRYARDILRSKKTIKIKFHLFACIPINSNNTKKDQLITPGTKSFIIALVTKLATKSTMHNRWRKRFSGRGVLEKRVWIFAQFPLTNMPLFIVQTTHHDFSYKMM